MTKPFRFAVQTSTAADGKAWREKARKIESLGYSTLYIPDHFGDQWGPIVGMTIAAEATTTLNVGALVFDNDYRHPVVLAKEIATLDLASEGRVEFGIGAGWMKSDYDESGMDYDRPGVRIERMVEGLAVMKQLWRRVRRRSTASTIGSRGPRDCPRPAGATGRPKIVIGGGGRKRVCRVAARASRHRGRQPKSAAGAVDAGGGRVGRSPSCTSERIGWIREAAGDRFDDLELQVPDLHGRRRRRSGRGGL